MAQTQIFITKEQIKCYVTIKFAEFLLFETTQNRRQDFHVGCVWAVNVKTSQVRSVQNLGGLGQHFTHFHD